MPKSQNEEQEPKVLIPGLAGHEETAESTDFSRELPSEIANAAVKASGEGLEALIEGSGQDHEADDKFPASQISEELQPAGGKAADREEERDREPRAARGTAEELLMHAIGQRCARTAQRLRSYLTGSILVKLAGTGKGYYFDWSAPELSVTLADPARAADCTIELSEKTLLRAASGDLNPQIGMLTEKIKVAGRFDLAMYFFNLVGPEGQY